MKKLLFLFLIILGGAILLFDKSPYSEIRLGETNLKVSVADTEGERALGLSGQKELKSGEGKLFIFEEPGLYGFWMKDMNFAIDIVWIGEDFKVLGIEKGVKPETYPTIFYPQSEVKYVLEVPEGFSDTASFKVGDILFLGQ